LTRSDFDATIAAAGSGEVWALFEAPWSLKPGRSSRALARLAARETLIAAAVGLAFLAAWRFLYIGVCLLVALMIHVAIWPAVEALVRRGLRRQASVALVYGLTIALTLVVLVLLLPPVVAQSGLLGDRLAETYAGLRLAMADSELALLRLAAERLPARWTGLELVGPLLPGGPAPGDGMAAQALDLGFRAMFLVVAVLAMGYYWTLDRERMLRAPLLFLPPERREAGRSLFDEIEARVAAFYRGQLILCAAVGLSSTVAYLAIGLPYALTLGALAFVLEAVPLVGPVLAAIPAVVVALVARPEDVALVVLLNLVIQLAENVVLVPRVMDRAAGVNPLVTLGAIATFGLAFGLAGALLAVPLAAILQAVAQRLLFGPATAADDTGPDPSADLSRSAVGALRFTARELAEDVRKVERSNHEEADPPLVLDDAIEALALAVDRLLAQAEAVPTPDAASTASAPP
jgi:predicted PurR-regulated permease PerM